VSVPSQSGPFENPLAPPPAAPKGGKKEKAGKGAAGTKSPRELAAPYWKKAKAGLGWVIVGLVFLAVPGFAEFGKYVYERSGNALPDGTGWIQIEGYVNSNEPGSLRLTKRDEINIAFYFVPLVIGGLCLAIGRFTAASAPRSSGAKGMFGLSGLFTLVALAGAVATALAYRQDFRDYYRPILFGTILVFLLSEAWFLCGLAVVGAALKRPKTSRAVGLAVLVAGVVGGLAMAGTWNEWKVVQISRRIEYVIPKGAEAKDKDADAQAVVPQPPPPVVQPKKGKGGGKKGGGGGPPGDASGKKAVTGFELKEDTTKPEQYTAVVVHEKLGDDETLYTSAGGMIAWLLLIGVYWRAVGSARGAIRDWLDQMEDTD
jgi:hypothetical protein